MAPDPDPSSDRGTDLDPSLEAVADELYTLPVEDFVRVRNERVKQARAARDRDLAAAVGELRKPSVGAGVVNLLVHERPDLVDQLAELGEALRAAQETLAGPELRALSAQRHRVVASVVTEARKLAVAAGVKVSDQVARELEATFDAALTDPDAAAAVRSGRLTGTLSYAGLGTLTTGTATAPARRPPAKAKAPATAARPDREADADRKRAEAEAERLRQARRAAEQALQEAEREAESADAEREDAAATADQAELDRDDAQQQVADLTEQLERAQADAVAAANRVREAHRARSRAEHRAEEAHRRLDRARRALEAQADG